MRSFAAITGQPNKLWHIHLGQISLHGLIYTYNAAPWTITPYFQYTDVPFNAGLGLPAASTYGGAVLANYSINDNWNLAGRFEYIGTSGAGNLLYRPGSSALSFTMTPTWQQGCAPTHRWFQPSALPRGQPRKGREQHNARAFGV